MGGMLSSMSNSAKGLAALMALLLPVVMMAGTKNPQMMVWFMGLYIVLGVLGGLGVYFTGRQKKKKSKAFEGKLEENSQGAMLGEDEAKLDEMRREFKRGIDIYKNQGKNLYSLPWLLVVGESGSGKTEAIRRSDIGFPSGLQEFWQGTGGTMNMHWWFTNHAVILDTAGRLMVKDSNQAGNSSNQWQEFLKLLKESRPDCPVNGLCLVIPVSSLTKGATPGEDAEIQRRIDETSGQISRQLDTLRRELGIRFPVYIMISKSDQLVGFRQYFKEFGRAEDRFQILGWSNPEAIDSRVNPKVVGDFVRETAERIRKRLRGTMKDPVSVSGVGKRIDELDSMYSFPNSMAELAPNLERYLGNIFNNGGWVSEPPFLRGVYFSSALQQGAVLDGAIADALGMSLGEYGQGGADTDLSIAKNRSYFLRDLFRDKIFKESGLVLKEGKKNTGIKGWKLATLVTAATALVVIGLLAWGSAIQKPIETGKWTYLAEDTFSTKDGGFYPLISQTASGEKWNYRKKPIKAEEMLINLSKLGENDLDKAPDMGWLMAPASLIDGDFKSDRKEAYRNAVDGVIIAKLTQVAVESLEKRSEEWGQRSITRTEQLALRSLLEMLSAREDEVDTVEQIESLLKVSGLRSAKRGRFGKEITEPLMSAVVAAYPNGCIAEDYINKEALANVIDVLFTSEKGNLLPVLQEFEGIWDDISKLKLEDDASKYIEKADLLVASSNELKGFKSRINDILSNGNLIEDNEDEEFEKDLSDPTQLGFNLFENFETEIESLDEQRFETWQNIVEFNEVDDSQKEKLQLDLINRFCLDISNVPRHIVLSELVQSALNPQRNIDDPKRLRSVLSYEKDMKELKRNAKGVEEFDVITKFLNKGLVNYLSKEVKKELDFPLVFDRKIGGELGKPLTIEQVAGLTMLLELIDENSSLSSNKIEGLLQVAKCLVDMESLREGRISSRSWELVVKHNWKAAYEVIVKPTGGAELSWDFDTGREAREIKCYSGAKLWSVDSLDNKHPFNFGNKYTSWAPVYWALSEISNGGEGRAGASGNIGSHSVEVSVNLPEGFPRISLDLPTKEKL